MLARLGSWCAEEFKRWLPDPFVFAILLTIVLLAATLIFGRTVRGMRGFLLMFQPSEVAKLIMVICNACIHSKSFQGEINRTDVPGIIFYNSYFHHLKFIVL